MLLTPVLGQQKQVDRGETYLKSFLSYLIKSHRMQSRGIEEDSLQSLDSAGGYVCTYTHMHPQGGERTGQPV